MRTVLIYMQTEGRWERWNNKRTNGRDEGNEGNLKLPPRIRRDLRFLGFYTAYGGIPYRRFGTCLRSIILKMGPEFFPKLR